MERSLKVASVLGGFLVNFRYSNGKVDMITLLLAPLTPLLRNEPYAGPITDVLGCKAVSHARVRPSLSHEARERRYKVVPALSWLACSYRRMQINNYLIHNYVRDILE